MFLLVNIAIALTSLAVLKLSRLNGSNKPQRSNPSVATALLECANAIEGQNPREANELRASALAFLSVAR